MNKFTVTLLFAFFIAVSCFGQQEAQYTQFMENKMMLNPAYAGAREAPSIMLLTRNQWIGFDGAPTSQLISFNAPIFGDKVGVGMSVSHHSIGITENWTANMAYSYKIPLSNDAALRLGIQGSLRFWGYDFSQVFTIQDPSLDQAIPLNQSATALKGNFGLGAYFNTKKLYVGISAPYLYSNSIGFNQGETNLQAVERQHFYFMAGTMFPLNEKWNIKPSILAKYVDNAPADLDFNLSFVYDQRFTFGPSYRLGGNNAGESAALVFGFQVNNQFGLGLAYDFIISNLRQASGINPGTGNSQNNVGSLEVLVRYDLRKDAENITPTRIFY